jgi:hypothetical protein
MIAVILPATSVGIVNPILADADADADADALAAGP